MFSHFYYPIVLLSLSFFLSVIRRISDGRYSNISQATVIWSVETELGSSATLSITNASQLVLTNGSTGSNLWPSNLPASSRSSAQLDLRNDGNLVSGLWESFKHPTDSFLPNQTMNGAYLTSSNGKSSPSSVHIGWKSYFGCTLPGLLAVKGRKLSSFKFNT